MIHLRVGTCMREWVRVRACASVCAAHVRIIIFPLPTEMLTFEGKMVNASPGFTLSSVHWLSNFPFTVASGIAHLLLGGLKALVEIGCRVRAGAAGGGVLLWSHELRIKHVCMYN